MWTNKNCTSFVIIAVPARRTEGKVRQKLRNLKLDDISSDSEITSRLDDNNRISTKSSFSVKRNLKLINSQKSINKSDVGSLTKT